MCVLFLGPPSSAVLAHLRAVGEDVVQREEALTDELLDDAAPLFVVSHGYRHILRPPHVERLRGRAVNLHIAYLPWNRGADPNFWSHVEDTPTGVTIHYIDEGVDTGDIVAQREVPIPADATLRSSYELLQLELLDLFRVTWPSIRDGSCGRRRQEGPGSLHRMRDRAAHAHLLADGWDTPVARLRPSPR